MVSSRRRSLAVLTAFGCAFALAYSTEPVFVSNQNTYFLHGLAHDGPLAADWMAGTADPFPVFSAFARALADAPWMFVVIHVVFAGLYGAAWVGVVRSALRPSASALAAGAGGILVAHSIALRSLSERLPFSPTHALVEGVAEQHLLTTFLEPSSIGVLLVFAVWAGLERRWIPCGVLAGAAAAVHPSYAPSSALVFVVFAARAERWRDVAPGVVAGSLVALVPLAHSLRMLGGADATFDAAAREILVHERIPHHAWPGAWVGPSVVGKLAWIAGAAVLSSALRLLFVVGAAVGVVGAVAVSALHLDSLALAFPWRVSTLLVPLATGVIAIRATEAIGRFRRVVVVVAVVVAGAGAHRTARWLADPNNPFDVFAREVRSTVDVPSDALVLVPVDGLERFRLATGLPVVVDWKSHPYRADEVVEWHTRVEAVRAFDSASPETACDSLARLRRAYPITHVATIDREPPTCGALRLVAHHARYRLYEVADAR